MSTETTKKHSKRVIIFGGIVLIFAVIGLIATLTASVQMIGNLADNTKQKGEFEWLITPLVMQDPPPFENPNKLSSTTIITAGVWRLIMNEDTSKYPVDEFNFITVPQSDIEVQIKALFGDVKYTHETVGDTELMINYDSEGKSYIFPAIPHVLPYTPEVQEITADEDGNTVLTVGYILPGLIWEGDVGGKKYKPSADKVMEYVLKKDDKGNYKVHAMASLISGQDVNSTPSGQS